MSPTVRDIPAVLARHGVPPDADAATLLAALEAHGWRAVAEELVAGPASGAGRSPRFRAMAFRRRRDPLVGHWRGSHDHRQAAGRTAEEALGRVLAAVLEWEG